MAIATLTIDIQAKVANIEADIKRLAQQTEAAGKRAEEAFSGASDHLESFRNMAAGAMAAFAGSAVTNWVKGAIDGADALNDLAQQTGVAVKRLSEYRYAAQQSGTSMETLGVGFKALAKNIIDNDGALKQMGIATRDASGNLRGVDQVLDDVAGKFSGYQDGAAKSALAMELFGKAGQEMVPFLNNGKEGLAELSAEAEKLGIVMDERLAASAAAFNDTIDKLRAASEGAGGRLAGQLLPALNAVAESMLGTDTQTGSLQSAMDALAATIKTLVSGGYLVSNVFDQVGSTLGAAAAGISLALEGDFEGAKRALSENFDDIGTRAQATADKLAKVWGDIPASVASAADKAAASAGKSGAPIIAKARQDAGAVKDVYAELMHSLNKRLGEAEQLNELEKLNIELQEKKYAKLTPLERSSAQAKAMDIDVQKRLRVEGEATLKMLATAGDAQSKSLQALDDELKKAARDVAVYGKTRAEVAELDLQLIDAEIAAERELNAEIGVGSSEQLRHLERQRVKRAEILEASRKLEQMDAGKVAAEKAADAAAEAAKQWEKVIDRVNQAFHDGFVESLKDADSNFDAFADGLKTSLKAALADGLYQITAAPLVANIVGVFSGGASAGGTTADGQPAALSNGFGMLSGAQSLWGGVNGGIANAANSFAMSGFGQAAGLSTTAAMGPPTAAGVMGGPATVMTGAGSTFAAAAAPVLGALVAAYTIAEMNKGGWGQENTGQGYAKALVTGGIGTNVIMDRLFGHNRNVSDDARGIRGTFDLSGFTGENYQERSQKGGTFRSDRRWTDPSAIDADMDKALDSMLKQAVAGVQTIGRALNVETEAALEGFSHTFALQLSENGDMSKAGEKIAAELKKVQDELATRLVPNIADFARYGETASDTFGRLNQEVAATDAILLAMGKDAGEAFGAVGLASVKAREDLIDLAGGLDALASKTQSFYANFYSSDEQVQLAATQAQKVLAEGFGDIGQSIPATREAFRSLVESQDMSTEAGRKLWNSLLDLQDEFDAVADGADATATSMQSAADKLAAATTTAQQGQASLFDVFATDSQKLAAAQKLINDAFAGLGKSVPATAGDFLDLAKAIDPATEAGQSLIATLQKVSGAFSYVEKSAADSAAAKEAAAQSASHAAAQAAQEAAQAATQSSGSRRSVMDQFDPAGALSRAQSDIAAAFSKYGATDLIPTSRAGVSDVAGRIDTSTALGQQQMADLASLSGAFEAVFGAQESAARSAADAAKQAADEQARLAQQAADAAQRAVEDQMRAAQRAADEQMRLANQVHDSISNALRSLLGQSEQFENQSRQMAQATLQSALVIAKAGGSLSNFQGLDAALASVNKLDKATFATAAGYAVEFGRTANLLTQLEQYTRINGSHANGLDYVPFDGYVAQLHRGEKVLTASESAAASATADEVKALRSDLNAIGAALATNTQRTTRLLEKFDVEGIYTRV
jgi:hypothetical protein